MFDFVEVVNGHKIYIFLGALSAKTVILRKMDFLFGKGPDLSTTHFSQSKYPDPALRIKKSEFENKLFHI